MNAMTDSQTRAASPEGGQPRWRHRLAVWWRPLLLLSSALLALLVHTPAFASSGIPPVQYGQGSTGIAQPVTTAMENVAETIRLILGGTALVVILVAAVMNHFVQDPRAKERAKELVGAAVVGLLLAAFAPQIVNFIAGL
ncbi:pilin [Sulfobacillus thermosulfidooxidans]|uniref:pilin n=1 Tax=Sulfobacillus thermosulfidooxidans TaxID=28034 RepID=UPI000301B31B|nr:pilin [Sulfobacillus thermosulfidooxidans]